MDFSLKTDWYTHELSAASSTADQHTTASSTSKTDLGPTQSSLITEFSLWKAPISVVAGLGSARQVLWRGGAGCLVLRSSH